MPVSVVGGVRADAVSVLQYHEYYFDGLSLIDKGSYDYAVDLSSDPVAAGVLSFSSSKDAIAYSYDPTNQYAEVVANAGLKTVSGDYGELSYTVNVKGNSIAIRVTVATGAGGNYQVIKVLVDGTAVYTSPLLANVTYPLDINVTADVGPGPHTVTVLFLFNGEYDYTVQSVLMAISRFEVIDYGGVVYAVLYVPDNTFVLATDNASGTATLYVNPSSPLFFKSTVTSLMVIKK